jgi:hypothetical protein
MIAFVAVASLVTASCESTEPKKKKRPPLPGEDESDLSWNRPTGPNDISTPFGLPMSR